MQPDPTSPPNLNPSQSSSPSPPAPSPQIHQFDQITNSPEPPPTPPIIKNKIKLTIIVALISLSSFYFGFVLTFLETIPKDVLVRFYGDVIVDSASTLPILTGAMPVGAIFGSLLANVIMRYFTRRNFLIFVNILALLTNLLIQITNIYILLICRLVSGILVGLYMGIVPLYIHQLSPPSISGSLGAFTQMQHLLGNVVSYFFGMIFYLCHYEGEFMMRFQFQFTSLLILAQIVAVGVGFVPESPNSLLMVGRVEDAKEVLRQFNQEEYIQELIIEKMFENGQPQPPPQSTHKSYLIPQSYPQQPQLQMTPKSYILSFQLPLTQQFTGVNFIVTQLTAITAIYDQPLSHFTALIANFIQFCSTAVSAYLLGRVGRRTVILVGSVGLGVVTVGIGGVFWAVREGFQGGFGIGMGLIMVFNVLFGLTLGPVVWLYIPEIAEKRIVPLATATYWCGCSICVIVAPIITTIMNTPYAVFLFFGCYTLVMSIPNYFLVVQTKDQTPQQINHKFHSC